MAHMTQSTKMQTVPGCSRSAKRAGPRCVLIFFFSLLAFGCGKNIAWTEVEGRWYDQDRDQHMEVTPNHLVMEVFRAPANIKVYRADLKGDDLVLEPTSYPWSAKAKPPERQVWTLEFEPGLIGLQTSGRVWVLKRGGTTSDAPPRKELTGLWRQVNSKTNTIDYIEFTPWSTIVAVTWQASAQGARPKPMAEWWAYTSPESGTLELDGVTLASGDAQQTAEYSLESNTLTLDIGERHYTLRRSDSYEYVVPEATPTP